MKKDRLLSLDVFRGITIAAMILVNDPGSWSHVYAPFLHASWHGYTPTDLVFPFFIFMMGVAVSLSKPLEGKQRKSVIMIGLKRTLILFLIGLFLNAFPFFELSSLRIPGVLQRIALVFMACLWIHHHYAVRQQYFIGGGILVIYWLIMSFIPVPGVGSANLEAGTNFAAWIDELLLSGHMWSQTGTWDPEGVLSTFPAVVTGLMGMLTGKFLFSSEDKNSAMVKLFIAANLSILLALLWNMFFPINKSLWTSSYVLMSGGIAMHSFVVLYWLLDVAKVNAKLVFPFKVFGMNAIVVYAFAGVFSTLLGLISIGGDSLHGHIYGAISAVFVDLKLSSLVFALLFVSVCYVPIWVMYKKRVFVKV